MSHWLATILKRIRVIKRDIKSFILELILPMAIILLGMFLMRIPFIRNAPDQTLTYRTYLDEANSVRVPLSWAAANNAAFSDMQTVIESNYGPQFKVSTYENPTDVEFDAGDLFSIKQKDIKLKGGIYFQP